mgnify:FL=1
MNIFISGGCKNGKSYHAQELARDMAVQGGLPLYYLATMIPKDGEDRARIKRHLSERDGWGFDTIEQGTDICKCLSGGKTLSGKAVDSRGVFLLDSVTALLSNEMFLSDGTFVPDAPAKVAGDLTRFCRLTGNTVFVSDYIYSDASPYDELTESYRRGLAFIDRTLAGICGQVTEVSFGFVQNYK